MHLPRNDKHVRLDPSTLYWAVLDGSVLPRSFGLPRTQLGYLFEATLPVPIDDIHAVYHVLPDRKILACGMQTTDLEVLVQSGAITATPEAIPISGPSPVDPSHINLLTGTLEPEEIRAIRARGRVQLVGLAVVGVLLLLVGMERRHARTLDVIEMLDGATASLYQTLYPAISGGEVTLQQRARLTSELRRMRETRGVHRQESPNVVSQHLSDLLRGWVADTRSRVETISVSPSLLTVRGTIEDMASAESLANRLDQLRNWSVEPPQLDQTMKGVQFTIRLVRNPGASPRRRTG